VLIACHSWCKRQAVKGGVWVTFQPQVKSYTPFTLSRIEKRIKLMSSPYYTCCLYRRFWDKSKMAFMCVNRRVIFYGFKFALILCSLLRFDENRERVHFPIPLFRLFCFYLSIRQPISFTEHGGSFSWRPWTSSLLSDFNFSFNFKYLFEIIIIREKYTYPLKLPLNCQCTPQTTNCVNCPPQTTKKCQCPP